MGESERGLSISQDIHFTYKENPDMDSLCQGDVLEKTAELEEILKEVHPYFLKDNYKFFMVLSQSCDLVRRNGKNCKTPYITLAAIRDYNDFLERSLIYNKMAEEYNGFLLVDNKNKIRVSQLIERMYNNTEPEYFFLYREEALKFPKTMVVYLKVSIALKSERHYDTLLNAKILELSDEFKAKLGWLVGNMYSRVGTTDWESKMTDKDKKKMIESDINSRCIVGSKEQLRELKTQLDENSFDTHDQAIEFLSTIIVKSKYDKIIDAFEKILNQAPKTVDVKDKEFLLNKVKSNNVIKQLVN